LAKHEKKEINILENNIEIMYVYHALNSCQTETLFIESFDIGDRLFIKDYIIIKKIIYLKKT